jgi:tRNA modification GTPase
VVSEGAYLDECLALFMRAPRSFTGEDVVELQGHGGVLPVRRVLRAVLDAGARQAEPGEFTRRAFLNGRLDLVQAEAVLDLVRAKSDRAATAAYEQLEGRLSLEFDAVYRDLLATAADLEAALDFPEEEVPDAVPAELRGRLGDVRTRIGTLLDTSEEGHALREGALVVISGRPNVGKSTLLNGLLGRDRAIVSRTPGTTRDFIEEGIVLDGIPLRLVDTAGLRETACDLEQEGIRRAENMSQNADMQVFMIDCSRPLHPDDRARADALDPERGLIVLNKSDLGSRVPGTAFPGHESVTTSLVHPSGLRKVRHAIGGRLAANLHLSARPHAAISERHRRCLLAAVRDVEDAARQLALPSGAQEELAASSLRSALEQLGHLTGKTYEEELLDHIFARFCIGK